MGNIERGLKNVTVDSLERILKALGVQPWEAFKFGWEDAKPPERFDEKFFLGLAKNADPKVRPLTVAIVQNVLRWAQERRSRT